jgi:hypothetical protein
VVARTLKLPRYGAVGCIDWLDVIMGVDTTCRNGPRGSAFRVQHTLSVLHPENGCFASCVAVLHFERGGSPMRIYAVVTDAYTRVSPTTVVSAGFYYGCFSGGLRHLP